MLKVVQLVRVEGRLFVTVVEYGGARARPLDGVDRVRRVSDDAIWTVRLEDGPVAYSEAGVVVGSLLGLSVEGDAILAEGDELLPV